MQKYIKTLHKELIDSADTKMLVSVQEEIATYIFPLFISFSVGIYIIRKSKSHEYIDLLHFQP